MVMIFWKKTEITKKAQKSARRRVHAARSAAAGRRMRPATKRFFGFLESTPVRKTKISRVLCVFLGTWAKSPITPPRVIVVSTQPQIVHCPRSLVDRLGELAFGTGPELAIEDGEVPPPAAPAPPDEGCGESKDVEVPPAVLTASSSSRSSSSVSPRERRAARMLVPGAECAERGFRAEVRGLCADCGSSLLGSQLCVIPRQSAPYGARICASGRGFRRGLGRGFFFLDARLPVVLNQSLPEPK